MSADLYDSKINDRLYVLFNGDDLFLGIFSSLKHLSSAVDNWMAVDPGHSMYYYLGTIDNVEAVSPEPTEFQYVFFPRLYHSDFEPSNSNRGKNLITF